MPRLERGGKYVFEWSVLHADGSVLDAFGLSAGDRLLVLRGSNLAFVMAQTGPLLEIARAHPEVPVFDR